MPKLRTSWAILVFTFVFSLDASIPRNIFEKNPLIRVRVGKSLDAISIKGTDLVRTFIPTKNSKEFEGRKRVHFNCRNLASAPRKKGGGLLIASLKSKAGILSLEELDNKKFDGQLFISTSKNNKKCDVVHETRIESYLSTLLAKEMNASWPLEVLKAQAVAARTYALYRVYNRGGARREKDQDFYDLESSEKHQVSGGFFDSTLNTDNAIKDTFGYVLKAPSGKIVPAFFHAKCGGKILDPKQVWTNSVDGYVGKDCQYCHGRGQKKWKRIFSINKIKDFIKWLKRKNYLLLGQKKWQEVRMVPSPLKKDDVYLYLDDQRFEVKKSYFRRFFGRQSVKSNNFNLKQLGQSLLMEGEGLGHGVGMCQIGALYMAKAGKSFREILKYYYPHHQLIKLY